MRVNDYIFQSLVSLGLSDREAELYLFLLKNSSKTVSELVHKKRLSSAGAYKIIHSLLDKKMIELEEDKKPFRFKAISLEKLTKRFERQGRQWQRRSQQLKQLSYLDKLPESSEFIKEDDMSDFYLKILSKTSDFMGFMAKYEAIVGLMGQDLTDAFIKDRVRKGIRADGILFERSPLSE